MLGTHVESIDFNLPVDAVTEKPLFAFSCNRAIRESYDGPLMRATDGTDIGVDELSTNVGKQIDLLYDQKSRHGHSSNNATSSGPYPTLQGNASEYWLEFTGSESFSILDASHLDRAGVLAVCDPQGQGRKPVFTANNGTDELSLDIGTAYMRFALYGQGEMEDLFGGLDYPDLPRNGYVANYDTNILLRSVDGKGGEAVATRPLPVFSSMLIGRDMAGNNFEGKLIEIVICDFPIPLDAEQEVFNNWETFYSLT